MDDRSHFQTAMEEGRITFSDPIIGRAIGEPLIGFAVPLWSNLDTPELPPEGALIGGISIEQFVETLKRIEYERRVMRSPLTLRITRSPISASRRISPTPWNSNRLRLARTLPPC